MPMTKRSVVTSLVILIVAAALIIGFIPVGSGTSSSACVGYGYGYNNPSKRCQPLRKTPLVFKILNIGQ